MAKRQNAYYNGISEEILRKCQAQINVYEKAIEQLNEEDIRQIYFEDINQLKEIIEIVQTDEYLIDEREETLVTCKELVDEKINHFKLSELETGNLKEVELHSYDVKIKIQNLNGVYEYKLIDEKNDFSKVFEVDKPHLALEVLNSYVELTGEPTAKLEAILETMENKENAEENEKTQEKELLESMNYNSDSFESAAY